MKYFWPLLALALLASLVVLATRPHPASRPTTPQLPSAKDSRPTSPPPVAVVSSDTEGDGASGSQSSSPAAVGERPDLNPSEREERIKMYMDELGMSREEAEGMLSQDPADYNPELARQEAASLRPFVNALPLQVGQMLIDTGPAGNMGGKIQILVKAPTAQGVERKVNALIREQGDKPSRYSIVVETP